ncbi:hypothetical protein OHR68_43255 [Spirillospora sp. NBC_00431]
MTTNTHAPAPTPRPGHVPWYEIQTCITGRDAVGWAIIEPTGLARAGCRCGLSLGWDETSEVLARLRATCYTPGHTPPSPGPATT